MPSDLADIPLPTFLVDRPKTTAPDLVKVEAAECPEIHRVPLGSLKAADSPRLGGVDHEHVEVLAQGDIEPILVHRDTRRVVDGMHRLQAARLQGKETIPVRYLERPASEVFIHSVAANVSHGLPLTLADRRAAARRILGSHPDLSDRSIARITRLSPKTVSAVRRVSTEEVPQSNVRVGADGRSRPLDAARRREAARAFLAEHPDATLNEAAASAGISVSTACEVRQRMRRDKGNSAPRQSAARGARDRNPGGVDGRTPDSRCAEHGGPRRAEALAKDPSLRLTESGRALLRWLNERAPDLEVGRQLMAAVPPHCSVVVADLANFYATEWQRFAHALDQVVAEAGEE
ncbi:ParB/RepB/Spo0J family partition protein (plasmid) [Streptomyces cyaneofuscatus]|uniref:ParB/RepB/Spo0J family partition protein n=1 Tax=Streptomyces cyaneofuscatus TaxID=66883 RepID=UPI002F90BF4C|nr:ParB/RepB/Spo0J family partition protein [Streptomyces cyaneofuscatus]